MLKEKPEAELDRLRAEVSKAWRDAVFGGLSPAERSECNRKAERIHQILSGIHKRALTERSSAGANAEQKRQWTKDPETDAPQAEAHQPYRGREKDLKDSSADWRRQREPKQAPEEEGGE